MQRRSSRTRKAPPTHLRCPYHGWTYSLEGELKGTPEFAGVCDFDRSANGLVPVESTSGRSGYSQGSSPMAPRFADFIGSDLTGRFPSHEFGGLQWMERRSYSVDCNWKVFVDNYLDGGYHVPHLHKGLDSVLDYSTLHDRKRRPLLPAVEPDGRRAAPTRGQVRCERAIARSTSGCIRTS